jgi:hypothetical protein
MNAKKHTRFGRFRERVWRLWQQRRERLHHDPAYIFNDHASRNIAEEAGRTGWTDELKGAQRFVKPVALAKMDAIRDCYPRVSHRAVMRVLGDRATVRATLIRQRNEAEDPKKVFKTFPARLLPCPQCKGSGQNCHRGTPCAYCRGRGKVTAQEQTDNERFTRLIFRYLHGVHEAEDPKDFLRRLAVPRVRSITVVGRRWFRRGYGGTYHTAEIFVNGERVHKTPEQYGYDKQYLWTAWEWLVQSGQIPPLPRNESPWNWCKDHGIELDYYAHDVRRERDL